MFCKFSFTVADVISIFYLNCVKFLGIFEVIICSHLVIFGHLTLLDFVIIMYLLFCFMLL